MKEMFENENSPILENRFKPRTSASPLRWSKNGITSG